MKIPVNVFVSFLEQVSGTKSDTIRDTIIHIEPGRLLCRTLNLGGARQITVSWAFATPTETPDTLVIGNLPDFVKAVKRFKGDIEVAFHKETGNIHVSSDQKQFQWPQLMEESVRSDAKELKFPYKITFTMEESMVQDALGDLKTIGDNPMMILEHKKGEANGTISFTTGARFASFMSKFPITDPELEFRFATRMFSILELAEGLVTFKLVDARMPVQITYKTSTGVEVEHFLAPFYEDA